MSDEWMGGHGYHPKGMSMKVSSPLFKLSKLQEKKQHNCDGNSEIHPSYNLFKTLSALACCLQCASILDLNRVNTANMETPDALLDFIM
jgi:hypothetical protein